MEAGFPNFPWDKLRWVSLSALGGSLSPTLLAIGAIAQPKALLLYGKNKNYSN